MPPMPPIFTVAVPAPWRRAAVGFVVGWAALLGAGCQTSVAVPPGGGVALQVPGGIARLAVGECALPGEVIVTTRGGGYFLLLKDAGRYRLQALERCPRAAGAEVSGMLSDGIVGLGKLTIKKTWLAGPTRRYGHGILGDEVEASQLRVEINSGRVLTFTLDAGSVFEDLWPRVVDLEGDGQEEVLLVRSRLDAGSSVALFGVVNGRLRLLAESEPFGQRNRWLNPVGVADFDGDRRREIAVVLTPHIGGTLALYRRIGTRLVRKYGQPGFSNHAIGSRELGMSAIIDLNNDLMPDLVVPGADRKSLRIVTFASGRFRELRSYSYGREIVTAVLTANFRTQVYPDLVFGLEGGTLVILPR